MLYLCDTHSFIWFLSGGERRLGRAARRVLSRAERGMDEVRISTVSLFEITQLVERGRIRALLNWDGWLSAATRTPGFAIEPLEAADVACARELGPLLDPFDRLIAGTALRLGVPLITADQRIAGSGLVRVVS